MFVSNLATIVSLIPDVVQKTAACEGRDVLVGESEVSTEQRRVRRQPLAMAVSASVTRLNRQRETHNHGFGRIQIVGVALEANERADARAEFVRVEGFGDEVVGAGVDATDAILGVLQRGHEVEEDTAASYS